MLSPGLTWGDTPREALEKTKATYVYRLSQMIGNSKGDEYIICFHNKTPFSEEVLALFLEKRIDEKPISIRSVGRKSDLSQCNTVYFTDYTDTNINGASISGNTLTISDVEGFAERGGMFELVEFPSSVKFVVNINAVKQKGFSLPKGIVTSAEKVIK